MVKDFTTKKTKIKAQVKSRFYYLFWGIATLSVVTGQIMVGHGYRQMSEEIKTLNHILYDRFNSRFRLVPIPPALPDRFNEGRAEKDDDILFLNDV